MQEFQELSDSELQSVEGGFGFGLFLAVGFGLALGAAIVYGTLKSPPLPQAQPDGSGGIV